jgi:hypothetical protein
VSVSESGRASFLKSSLLELEYQLGEYSVFQRSGNICDVCIVSEPIAVISPLLLKNRQRDDIDYVRLNELLMESKADIVFVQLDPEDKELAKKLSYFKTVVVLDDSEYVMNIVDSASHDLEVYSFAGEVPAYTRDKEGLLAMIEDIDAKHASSIPGSGTIKRNEKHLDVSIDEGPLRPVLIKDSYFPSWENSNGNPVFAATPFNMLTFAEGDFSLDFKTPIEVCIGWVLTVAGIIIALIKGYYLKAKK